MDFDVFIERIRGSPQYAGQIVHVKRDRARRARFGRAQPGVRPLSPGGQGGLPQGDMAVAQHVFVRDALVELAPAVHGEHLRDMVPGFVAVAAGVHRDRAAHGAGYAGEELDPSPPGLLDRGNHVVQPCPGAGEPGGLRQAAPLAARAARHPEGTVAESAGPCRG